MRAVLIDSVGGPEALVVRELPDPPVDAGQSLVEVGAAAINYAEILIRRGLYPQAPELPWVPGMEIAGTTPDGRRVLGLVTEGGGGYAERVAIDDEWLVELPESASLEEGAAFAMAFLTAWLPLTRQTSVRAGMRVLVTAAAGGVGSAAVQVAQVLGGDVVAAVGSEEKYELPRSLGAVEVVTYDALESLDPVDVVFDLVGGDVFVQALQLLHPLGVAVAVGYAGGMWQPLDPARLVGRNVGVCGFYLGRLMLRRAELVRLALGDLVRLWTAGELHPVVGASFPLDQVAEAHRLVEARRSTGKVVLVR